MIPVIVFACLLGVCAGAVHLYHHYIIAPKAKADAERVEMLREQIGTLRVQIIKMQKRLDIVEYTMTAGDGKSDGFDAFALASRNENEEDIDEPEADDQVEQLRTGAINRVSSFAEVRAQLPMSAVGPGWAKRQID